MESAKLDVKAFGLTAGLLWGFSLFLFTWWIILFDGAKKDRTFLGRLYRGYEISPTGSVIGLLWALADGAIGGVIFAWLYNLFSVGNNQPVVTQAERSEMASVATH